MADPRPLTPRQALDLAKTVSDLYGDASARLLEVVARRLAKGLDQPGWATARLAEVLQLRTGAQKVVAAMQADSTGQVLAVVGDAYAGGRIITPVTPGGGAAVHQRAVVAYASELNRTLAATHTRMLRSTEDVYRQVISETAGSGVVGADSRRAVAVRAMDRFAAQGVTGFTDTAGRRWQLESYTEMATRTTVGQTHLQGTLDRFEQAGRDLVVVSNSPEECPDCRPFEGKVLSASGLTRAPPDVPGSLWGGSLSGARSKGLFHPACTHSLGAWVPGLTKPMTDTANPQGYEDRQRQRELERRVRESKRRVSALAPFGDTPRLRQQKALLVSRRADLKGFVVDKGRKPDVSRRRTSTRVL